MISLIIGYCCFKLFALLLLARSVAAVFCVCVFLIFKPVCVTLKIAWQQILQNKILCFVFIKLYNVKATGMFFVQRFYDSYFLLYAQKLCFLINLPVANRRVLIKNVS